MRILIAPDKFKSSLSAVRVAEAMTRGARKIHPEASFSVRPVADGGEGTLDAFLLSSGGRVREITVPGPLGEPVLARIALLHDGRRVIEMADAAGLALIEPSPDSALRADTRGVGRSMIEASRSEGDGPLLVAVGGSASTDGGTGAASEWGWRFLDRAGKLLTPGGGALTDLAHIEPPDARVPVVVEGICDVDNPVTGTNGAARTFGPQKGADADAVRQLEEGLNRLVVVVARDVGCDIGGLVHGGAGGGMGAGLVAFFDAALRPGLDAIAEATGLGSQIDAADLVITGEGRLDRSSLNGKAPVAVAKIASRSGTPCVAITGDLQLERQALKKVGISEAVGLLQSGGGTLADSDPEKAIEKATEGLLRMRLEKTEGWSFRKQRSFRR